jgi:arylsulfatase A-like enzyme
MPATEVPPPKTPGEAFIHRLTGKDVLVRQRTPVPTPDYLTDEFARQATSFISQYRERPFFLLVAFNAVHVPLQATKKYLDRFPEIEDANRRTFAAMLSAVDDAVGVIQQKLVDEGLDRRTLVFFLSDNGGHPQANTSRNDPLRGAKSTIYEGGIRVPFFVKWTGSLPAGRVYSEPVMNLDVLPTSLAAADRMPMDERLDGVNLLPYLRGEKSGRPHDTLYWRYGNQRAIRHGDWKLTMPADEASGLYNLAADISEANDQSQGHPEIAGELRRRFDAWEAQLQPPRWQSMMFKKDATKSGK